jgi:sugar phosphate isomerase/epimerase
MAKFILSAFADEASSDFTAQLETLKRHEIPLVEVRGVDGKNILDLTDEELDIAVEKLNAYGIGVSAVGSPIGKIGIHDDFAPHFEKFKRAVEIAKKLGTTRIRMFSFFMPKDEDPEQYFDTVVEQTKAMVEYAEANGVHCCHENEKGIYGDTLARVQKLHAAVPGLRLVFDPANYIQCHDRPADNFAALSHMIDYMHIKDALADGKVVPPGNGIGNVAAIVEAFGKQGGKVLSLEPHLNEFVGLQNLEREGDVSVVGNMAFANNEAAFDYAAKSLKKIVEGIV